MYYYTHTVLLRYYAYVYYGYKYHDYVHISTYTVYIYTELYIRMYVFMQCTCSYSGTVYVVLHIRTFTCYDLPMCIHSSCIFTCMYMQYLNMNAYIHNTSHTYVGIYIHIHSNTQITDISITGLPVTFG